MAIRIRANTKTKEITLPMGMKDPKTGELTRKVLISAMDGHDEEMVSEKKIRRNGAKIISNLLSVKIVGVGNSEYPKGIGLTAAKAMWTADRDTCLKEIRGLMADDMIVKPKCTDCGETDEDVIYMSQLEVGEWDSDNLSEGVMSDEMGVLMFELPDGLIVSDDETGEDMLCRIGKIRLSNGSMEENIAQAARDNMGFANTVLLAASIVELENIRTIDQNLVQALSKADRDYLSRLLADNNPGPKFLREHTCSNCGTVFKYLLKLPDFFTSGTSR